MRKKSKRQREEEKWQRFDSHLQPFLNQIVDHPEVFIDATATNNGENKTATQIQQVLKAIYDHDRGLELLEKKLKNKYTKLIKERPLNELFVENMDAEQIWEQLKLHSNPSINYIEKELNQTLKQGDVNFESVINSVTKRQKRHERKQHETDQIAEAEAAAAEEDDDDDDLQHDEDDAFDDMDDLNEEDEDNDLSLDGQPEEDGEEEEEEEDDDGEESFMKKPGKRDRFFSMDDMERFVEDAEDEQMREDDILEGDEEMEDELGEDDEDLAFRDDEEEDADGLDAESLKYSDFFGKEMGEDEEDGENMDDMMMEEEDDEEDEEEDENDAFWLAAKAGKPKKSRGLSQLLDDQDEEEEIQRELGEALSSFQKKEKKITSQIEKLEEANVAAKPWVLQGEVTSKNRPKNSLLEVELDFEGATKVAPVVTEDFTNQLDEMIKKRIIDEAYDDVIRKRMPVDDSRYKPRFELDHEKSKKSLADIYEQEYMEKVMGAEKDDPVNEKHQEIQDLFNKICFKLDALANFHFVPTPAKPDVTIKTINLPTIAMEEVTPIATTTGTLLAPEEVYKPKSKSKLGVLTQLTAEGERTQEDRKHLRKAYKNANKKEKEKKAQEQSLKEKLDPSAAQKRLNSKAGKKEALQKITQHRNTKVVSTTGTSSENVSSSTALFKKLQEETQKTIGDAKEDKKGKKTNQQPVSSSRLKL